MHRLLPWFWSAEIEGISLAVEIKKLAAMLAAIAFAAAGPILSGRLDPWKMVLPSAFSCGFVALVLAAMLRGEPMVTKGTVFFVHEGEQCRDLRRFSSGLHHVVCRVVCWCCEPACPEGVCGSRTGGW